MFPKAETGPQPDKTETKKPAAQPAAAQISRLDFYVGPIVAALAAAELSKGNWPNHELIATHAVRFARAAIDQVEKPFTPSKIVVSEGAKFSDGPPPSKMPANLPPSPLSPEINMPAINTEPAQASPVDLKTLMTAGAHL